jgi:alpha-tubulin suppressor-like RCC1 family protein
MPYISTDGDFERVFMTSTEFVDQFVGTNLYTWGSNGSGQLGDGTTTSRSSPVTTAGAGTNWKQVATVATHTAAIKTDGTLWTWGNNGSGRVGDGTTTDRSSPVTTAGGGTNWKEVSVGGGINGFDAAIKTDGTLWTWGNNTNGRLGDGTTTPRSSPGTTAGGGSNWKQVSAGATHIGAIKTDGTLWTWGNNGSGRVGDGTTTDRSSPVTTAGGGTNWKQVSFGRQFSSAIKTDGTLWTWGDNSYGALGDGTTLDKSSPVTTAGGGTNWKQVYSAAGGDHMAAIKTDGTLWTWGNNGSGRLGDGTTTNKSSPVTTVGGGTNWKQVSAGDTHIAAIKTDGTLWTWGGNTYGQLGNGTTTSISSPSQVISNVNNWKQVGAGESSTAAVAQN